LQSHDIAVEKFSLCKAAFKKQGVVPMRNYYQDIKEGTVCDSNESLLFESQGFRTARLFNYGEEVTEDGAGCVGFDPERFGRKSISCKRGQVCGGTYARPSCITVSVSTTEEVIPVDKDEGLFHVVAAPWSSTKHDWALCAKGQTMVIKTGKVYCKGTEQALILRAGQVCPNTGKGRCKCQVGSHKPEKCYTGEACLDNEGKPECVQEHNIWFCGGEDACKCDGTFKGQTYYCKKGSVWGGNYHATPTNLEDDKVATKERLMNHYWQIYWQSGKTLNYQQARRQLGGLGDSEVDKNIKI
jgi:hypothetical protein